MQARFKNQSKATPKNKTIKTQKRVPARNQNGSRNFPEFLGNRFQKDPETL